MLLSHIHIHSNKYIYIKVQCWHTWCIHLYTSVHIRTHIYVCTYVWMDGCMHMNAFIHLGYKYAFYKDFSIFLGLFPSDSQISDTLYTYVCAYPPGAWPRPRTKVNLGSQAPPSEKPSALRVALKQRPPRLWGKGRPPAVASPAALERLEMISWPSTYRLLDFFGP